MADLLSLAPFRTDLRHLTSGRTSRRSFQSLLAGLRLGCLLPGCPPSFLVCDGFGRITRTMVPKVRILIAALSLLLPLFARCMPAPWDVHPGGLRRGVEDLNPVAATRTKAVITARTDNHKRAPDSGLPFV